MSYPVLGTEEAKGWNASVSYNISTYGDGICKK